MKDSTWHEANVPIIDWFEIRDWLFDNFGRDGHDMLSRWKIGTLSAFYNIPRTIQFRHEKDCVLFKLKWG